MHMEELHDKATEG